MTGVARSKPAGGALGQPRRSSAIPCKLRAGRVPFAGRGDARSSLSLPRSASGARILATYIVFTRESMHPTGGSHTSRKYPSQPVMGGGL